MCTERHPRRNVHTRKTSSEFSIMAVPKEKNLRNLDQGERGPIMMEEEDKFLGG